jgi:hypothetical protein
LVLLLFGDFVFGDLVLLFGDLVLLLFGDLVLGDLVLLFGDLVLLLFGDLLLGDLVLGDLLFGDLVLLLLGDLLLVGEFDNDNEPDKSSSGQKPILTICLPLLTSVAHHFPFSPSIHSFTIFPLYKKGNSQSPALTFLDLLTLPNFVILDADIFFDILVYLKKINNFY